MTGTPSTTGRRADAVANRAAILDAATRVLLQDPDASLATVAAEAGLARRTVYGHFASRDVLVAALAEEVGGALAGLVQDPAADAESADALLRLARFVHASSAYVAQLHPLGALARTPHAQSHLAQAVTGVRRWVAAQLAEAARAGLVDADLAPELGAHLVGGLQWSVFDAVVNGHVTEAAAPELAVRTTLRAVGATPAVVADIVAATRGEAR